MGKGCKVNNQIEAQYQKLSDQRKFQALGQVAGEWRSAYNLGYSLLWEQCSLVNLIALCLSLLVWPQQNTTDCVA